MGSTHSSLVFSEPKYLSYPRICTTPLPKFIFMNCKVPVTHSTRDTKEVRGTALISSQSPSLPTDIAIYDSEMNSIAQAEDGPRENTCCASPLSAYPKLSTEV